MASSDALSAETQTLSIDVFELSAHGTVATVVVTRFSRMHRNTSSPLPRSEIPRSEFSKRTTACLSEAAVTAKRSRPTTLHRLFDKVAAYVARLTGRPLVFLLALGTVVTWGVSGPLFGFSDTWQLVINTGTTIVTFLMVFLIQNSQNRDSAAIQIKLDELIRVSEAKNAFVGIEHLTEHEIEELRARCEQRAKAQLQPMNRWD